MPIAIKNWRTVSFGEVASQDKQEIDREVEKVDKYIAGEHMDTEDLHIHRWGVLDGQYLGPAFIRKFEKGDILYGSRRTYLKKVAVAEFDGVTANTTFVIKPKKDEIFPGLLPFLMLSDSFTAHSVKNSKGSVNPYINWKDIANFTFKLPSMDQQKQISDILWEIDVLNSKYKRLIAALDMILTICVKSLVKQADSTFLLAPGEIGEWHNAILEENCTIKNGFAFDGDLFSESEGVPLVRIRDLKTNKPSLFYKGKYSEEYLIENNDLLIGMDGEFKCYRWEGGRALLNQRVCRIRTNDTDLDRDFLFYVLNEYLVRIEQKTSSTTVKHISSQQISKIQLPIPNIKQQKIISNILGMLDQLRHEYSEQTVRTSLMSKTMVNQIFG